MNYESSSPSHVTRHSQPLSLPGAERLSSALGKLPVRTPPAHLKVSLRVIASRERQRQLERRSLAAMVAAWADRVRLTSGEMMRSLVLPMAGGVFTAVVLFSTWLVPTYPLRVDSGFDVPTMLTTEATVTETGVIGLSGGGDAIVDVLVDNQGRVADYSIVSGTDMLQDASRRHRFENLLLATQFNPATKFGQPMVSKVRMLFRQTLFNQIDVTD